jgi:hypothetical protein
LENLLLIFSGHTHDFALVTLMLRAADFSATLTKTYEITLLYKPHEYKGNLCPTPKQNMQIIFP